MVEKYTAQNTFDVLRKHILVDGYPVVVDLEKSRGSHLIDAQLILIFSAFLPAIP